MENIIIFDKIKNELESISKNEALSSIRVRLEDFLWLLDCAKSHYKNDIELARLQGKNDALKEMVLEKKKVNHKN